MKRLILVTGGTGTLGGELIPLLLRDPMIERVRVLSRGEHRQAILQDSLGKDASRVDFFVGDVRDEARVVRATQDVTDVFHLAATKRVESAEYNPGEAIATNVYGSQNVISACSTVTSVEKATFVSTDKSVQPKNVYGLTKGLAERVWIQANVGKHRCKFQAARYGNVLASQGSVLEIWERIIKRGEPVPVTDDSMTRFFFLASQAAQFVLKCHQWAQGAEVFIPILKACSMRQLAQAFLTVYPGKTFGYTSIPARPGEKKHEVLISEDELDLTTTLHDKHVRWPEFSLFPVTRYGDPLVTAYTSLTADKFSPQELEALCRGCLSHLIQVPPTVESSTSAKNLSVLPRVPERTL